MYSETCTPESASPNTGVSILRVGDHYDEPLAGETLVDGQYRRNEMQVGDGGVVMWHSPVLVLWLYFEDGQLNFYDPAQGRRLSTLIEEIEARRAAEARLRAAEDGIERLRLPV